MGAMIYMFLGDMVVNDISINLEKTAQTIANSFLVYNEDEETYPWLQSWFVGPLKSHSENTRASIWIVDKNGFLRRYEAPDNIQNIHMTNIIRTKFVKTQTDSFYKLPDDKYYKKVMTGNYEVIREVGDFQGLLSGDGKWLTIVKPIVISPISGKKEIWGAVYMHMPVPAVLESRAYIFKFFLYSSAIAIALSTLLLFFLVKKMIQPLKEISNAARHIAKGDFEERLDVKSKDEVGKLAESFNYMASELQNMENNRRQFVANVSHELRTPMTSIRGFINGILDGTIPENKQEEYLEIVRNEADRLGRLVTDLLDLSRIESGELRLVLKVVNINEIIGKCVIKLENYINKKGIKLNLVLETDPLKVSADIDAIERVILNLVYNAIKFTSEGGNITISTATKRNGKVEVSVKDNGCGIEQSELERIFDRFYKTDKSRSDDRRGTGLGLAIVSNIIREHKQEIYVESKLGVGSTFTFTLDKVN